MLPGQYFHRKLYHHDTILWIVTSNYNYLLIIVAEVVVDGRSEVQQKVPGVFRNGSFMVFLEKCVPQVQELEPRKLISRIYSVVKILPFPPWQCSSRPEPCRGPDPSERDSWHSWRWTDKTLWIYLNPRFPSPDWVFSVLTCPVSHNLHIIWSNRSMLV